MKGGIIRIKLIGALLAAFFSVSPTVHAAVSLPALDISTLGPDAGVASDGSNLTMDATVFSILTGGTPIDIPDAPFTLNASYSTSAGSIYFFSNGTLSAGSLLTANFDTLTLTSLGSNLGQFNGDLTYTGGSLVGGLTSGRIEGVFSGATSGDFSQAFTASNLSAKIGAVVPVPAAIWLFSSGLIGLVGLANTHKRI